MVEHSTPSIRAFRPGDETPIQRIMEGSVAAGEQPGTTPHDIDATISGLEAEPDRALVATANDQVIGFLMPGRSLLAVDPAYRRRGHGSRLVAAAIAAAANEGKTELSLASFGRPEPEAFLQRLDFAYQTSLWLLRLPSSTSVPAPSFPAGITVRELRRDENIERYVVLINTAFADHPTPLAVEEALVRHVHARPDFDPTTTAVVTPRTDPERLVAFCRTVLIPENSTVRGDVTLIGVLPDWRGQGLGRELLRWGIDRVRRGGAGEITLTVEARNERALGLYERHGFERVQEWPQWSKPI